LGKDDTSVEIPTVYNEGAFGLNIEHIKHVTKHNQCIYVWFTDAWEQDETWDMEIPAGSDDMADLSYTMLTDLLRRFKLRRVK
jgi:hypothetical protein